MVTRSKTALVLVAPTLLVAAAAATLAGGAGGPGGARRTLDTLPAPDTRPALARSWPGFLRTPEHAGVAPVVGPTSGRLRWQRRLEGPIAPGAAIGSNGVAYVASNAGVLHAIRVSDGRDLWRFDGHGGHRARPSTGPAIPRHRAGLSPRF